MRSLVGALVAAGALLSVPGPTAAAPSADYAALCRASYPQLPSQLRCIAGERASQERLTRAQPSVDAQVWARCQAASNTWQEMEACIAQPATAAAPGAPGAGGTEGAAPGPAADAQPNAPPGAAGQPGAPGATAAVPPAAATPAPDTGSGSTIILGPRPSAAAAPEPDRPTRPVSEEEAERQLKDVLQRAGAADAHCTKKQYGAGWVTVCE